MSRRYDLSRRDFLKATSLVMGTGVLGGIEPLARATEKGKVAVGVARGETIGGSVRKAVELAGGMDFIPSGRTILIKPNVNTGDPHPGSTNPEVLHEVIKLVWERDPKRVIVGDRSMYRRETSQEMRKNGIEQAARDAKAELITFDYLRWEMKKPAHSANWQNGYHVTELISQVDYVINVPVIKTHFLAWYTMSVKNLVGVIHANDRIAMHDKLRGQQPQGSREGGQEPEGDYPTFAKMIAELGLIVKPALNIMDGTRAFVGGGPSSGDVVEPKLIVASRDMIANDATGLAILKHYGTEERIQAASVWEQPVMARGVEIGLGVANASQIELKGEQVPELEDIRAQMA